jgi:hypothetical protein
MYTPSHTPSIALNFVHSHGGMTTSGGPLDLRRWCPGAMRSSDKWGRGAFRLGRRYDELGVDTADGLSPWLGSKKNLKRAASPFSSPPFFSHALEPLV